MRTTSTRKISDASPSGFVEQAAEQADARHGLGRGGSLHGGGGGFAHERRTFGLSQPCARSTTRLTTTTIDGGDNDEAHHQRDVTLAGGPDGDLAEAGDREDLLDDDRAAEQADELHREEESAGAGGVAEHVPVDDAGFRQSAAAEGTHVVLAAGRR